MRGDVKQTYIIMGMTGIPVVLLNIAGFMAFGIGYADAPAPDYSTALMLFGSTFLALGISISMFKASIDRLRRQLNDYAFQSVMRNRITPIIFFAFGLVVGSVLSIPSSQGSVLAIDEIEAMRQLTAGVLVMFTGAAAGNSIKMLQA